MLAEIQKNSIREAVDKLLKLDSIGMMIIMSNATALLARQEIEERKAFNRLEEAKQLSLMEYAGEKIM